MKAAGEAAREQVESSFTPPLRWVLESDASIQAVAFVDSGGECIDYCSRVPSHEAKVAGAVLDLLLRGIRPSVDRLGGGAPWLVHLFTNGGTLVARPVDADYMLGVLVAGDVDVDVLDQTLGVAAGGLREAAGLATPLWEPTDPVLEVALRPALGWPHAPASFVTAQGCQQVEAVLGRWVEERPWARVKLECFRIRTEEGHELTLARDRRTGRWTRT